MLRAWLNRYHCVLAGTVLASAGIVLCSAGAARWLWLSLLFTLAGLVIGLGVAFPRWQMFGPSLCRVRTQDKVVALTFDDGPDPETTPALLGLLATRGIHATFFCIGQRVEHHAELVRRMAAEGHQVENHSHAHHPTTNLFSTERLRSDVAQAQRVIQSVTGRLPVCFRPPMCLTNQRVFRVAAELGLTVAGYTARGFDRRPGAPGQITARLMRCVRPGAILLLHDAGVPRDRLLAVVTGLLDQLQAAGYECRRLDELAPGAKPLVAGRGAAA